MLAESILGGFTVGEGLLGKIMGPLPAELAARCAEAGYGPCCQVSWTRLNLTWCWWVRARWGRPPPSCCSCAIVAIIASGDGGSGSARGSCPACTRARPRPRAWAAAPAASGRSASAWARGRRPRPARWDASTFATSWANGSPAWTVCEAGGSPLLVARYCWAAVPRPRRNIRHVHCSTR